MELPCKIFGFCGKKKKIKKVHLISWAFQSTQDFWLWEGLFARCILERSLSEREEQGEGSAERIFKKTSATHFMMLEVQRW